MSFLSPRGHDWQENHMYKAQQTQDGGFGLRAAGCPGCFMCQIPKSPRAGVITGKSARAGRGAGAGSRTKKKRIVGTS